MKRQEVQLAYAQYLINNQAETIAHFSNHQVSTLSK